jgi:hypothetical protein
MVGFDCFRSRMGHRAKREDTAEGCRQLAQDDRSRATEVCSQHMRHCLQRSADAWTARAALLGRLDASFRARAEAHARGHAIRLRERDAHG